MCLDAGTEKHLKFPLFIDLFNKTVAVVGGGAVATRRVATLLSFGANVKVIAPALTPQLTKWLNDGQIVHHPREFLAADLEDVVLALAATNDRDVNHQIAEIAASHNIPVSVADCKEECTFFFPAIAAADGFVAGLVSNGDDHKGVAQLAARVRTVLHDFRSGS